ncbi:hypothetical protein PanWU01x14_275410 [Parasponia andersonii]|uniref:Uncharacterized protein n=1 Tax=Parasponia andersonii TaxID=3476 RepID=A0A2P5B327_PARAD|nr:hypothetical protein PanWU01x14_275410 [Parasponia andersonii]
MQIIASLLITPPPNLHYKSTYVIAHHSHAHQLATPKCPSRGSPVPRPPFIHAQGRYTFLKV